MKPVDLIIANTLHDIAGAAVEASQRSGKTTGEILTGSHVNADAIARDMLRRISNEAPIPAVIKALAAAGGPVHTSEVTQRLNAVIEQQQAMASAGSEVG